jgi:hypothetical protein
MTAKELKMDNQISYKGKEHFVMGVSGQSVRLFDGKGEDIWVFEDEVEPIPLTEERLVELGFEKLVDRATGFKQSSYSIGNGMVIVNFDDGLLNVDFYRTLNYKYVHQLQNLYFALTGTELTTKSN